MGGIGSKEVLGGQGEAIIEQIEQASARCIQARRIAMDATATLRQRTAELRRALERGRAWTATR